MPKRAKPFPGAYREKDRHGTIRWRYRKGKVTAQLPGAYGSAEWIAAYEAARLQTEVPSPRTTAVPGTVAWLIEQYLASYRYRNLSPIRQKNLRGTLDWIKAKRGSLPYARMEPVHVERLMALKSGPAAQNTVRKTVALLYNFASAKLKYAGSNPARGADKAKERVGGYHTWTDDEVNRFLERHGPGTKARLAMLLALNTGMARQDVARSGWQLVKGGRIAYARGKTSVAADMPIMPDLAAELAMVPRDRMLFLPTAYGRAHTASGLGNWFASRCKEAGVPGRLHGLRKAAAVKLAEAGASEFEIMSFLGHSTPDEARTYIAMANRATGAGNALARLRVVKGGE